MKIKIFIEFENDNKLAKLHLYDELNNQIALIIIESKDNKLELFEAHNFVGNDIEYINKKPPTASFADEQGG